MRLISDFSDERKAYTFCQYLMQKGVDASYEAVKEGHHCIWIIEEDDFDKAQQLLAEFSQLPEEQQRKNERPKTISKVLPGIIPTVRGEKKDRSPYMHVRLRPRPLQHRRHPMTHFLLIVCGLLFFWNLVQETQLIKSEGKAALQLGFTPLQQKLLFDYPSCFATLQALLEHHPLQSVDEIATLPADIQNQFAAAEQCSYWKGFYDLIHSHWEKLVSLQSSLQSFPPLFEQIRHGQVWRLFTPCLLHRDLLHILFNMSWLIYLGRQIEDRLGKWRLLLLVVLIGVFSNIAQYLMSGPYFLGFSGVAVGLVGFIWMRQRMSPWEGYPLSNGIVFFLLIFILAMLFLEWISLGLQLFGKTPFVGHIANTAHISGGLIGLLLARIPLFAHKSS